MDTLDRWVIIGRFGRTHGLKGFIHVHSFTEPRDNILNYTHWHILRNKQWELIELSEVSHDKSILVKPKGYSEREHVACLTNLDIAVLREQLPSLEAGEFYWHELLGMQVLNLQGHLLGVVTEIMPTGANDVLIVSGEKQHLIPYLPEQFILKVDKEQHRITVDWDADF